MSVVDRSVLVGNTGSDLAYNLVEDCRRVRRSLVSILQKLRERLQDPMEQTTREELNQAIAVQEQALKKISEAITHAMAIRVKLEDQEQQQIAQPVMKALPPLKKR